MVLREGQFDVKETTVIKNSASVVKCLQESYLFGYPASW